jgi:hypothetical protein
VRDFFISLSSESDQYQAPPSLRNPKLGCIHDIEPYAVTEAPQSPNQLLESEVIDERRNVLHDDGAWLENVGKVCNPPDQSISRVILTTVLSA